MRAGGAIAATAVGNSAAAMKAIVPAADSETAQAPSGSVQELTLECKFIEKTITGVALKGNGAASYRCKLRSYNGNLPGQLIQTRPGQTLRIKVKNSLTPYDSTGWDGNHNVPHMLDSTNLHLHGLDIIPHLFEPLGTSNPFAKMIHIMPGQSYDYDIKVPDDQPPGLSWYHPHAHGSTAVQAVTGMAGPIITYGDIDEVPEIKAAQDILLAISDIGLFPSETEPDVWTYEPKQNAVWSTFAQRADV
jgi:FtsP/CotA-like multicopper oxidase with cupredoxin domain